MSDSAVCHFVPPYLLQRLAELEDDHHLNSCGRDSQRLDAELVQRRSTRPSSVAATDEDGDKTVYTADNREDLPGTKARGDGDPPTSDAAVDEAYDSTGQIYELFKTVFERDSVDGNGSAVTVTVHYGTNYDNAFWDGQQLVFGDGDGKVFGRFTTPPDVLFHEFTHGVTQFTAGLTYDGQSGALNESVSDCFASMGKQKQAAESADQADWLIGEGLFLPGINATALRSMKDPGTAYDDPKIGKDPQVGSMDDYLDTTDDNGGVHTNSGIPNRAFYLAATAIGGNSWEKPGAIWYAALTGADVSASTDFAGFAQATIASAQSLYGDDEADAVRTAWTTVGVDAGAASAPGAAARGRVVVRRSGGFTGRTREGEVDLGTSPYGDQIADLLARATRETGAPQPGHPDQFTYSIVTPDGEVQVAEAMLTPDLRDAIQSVLGD